MMIPESTFSLTPMTSKPLMLTLGKDRARKLARLSMGKERREQNRILLDSMPLVTEGLNSDLVVELFVESGRHEETVAAAEARGVRVTTADRDSLAKICAVECSPGLAALARFPESGRWSALDGGDHPLAVFLDRVSDPGNLGTIARSAAAFGCRLLIASPGCADHLAPKALRASAGALLRLPVIVADLADGHLESGSTWWRAVARGGCDPGDLELPERLVIWLGNEAKGAREAPAGASVVDVTIPIDGETESLNVSAAATVLLHTVAHRNRRAGP